MKKRGFGAGKWNGFGGKLNQGESIENAAKRELWEEVGVTVDKLKKIGILDFSWQGKTEILETHIFKVTQFRGSPVESEEMRPEWFHVNDIPFSVMWPDDILWMPMFIFDQKFKGKFIFDNDNNIIDHELMTYEIQ